MRCPPQGVAKPAIDGGVHHLKMLDIEAGRADGSETGIADGPHGDVDLGILDIEYSGNGIGNGIGLFLLGTQGFGTGGHLLGDQDLMLGPTSKSRFSRDTLRQYMSISRSWQTMMQRC